MIHFEDEDFLDDEDMFPVHYNGKDYTEEECSDTFLAFYNGRYSLNGLGGVYVAEGIWVYPDGSMDEY